MRFQSLNIDKYGKFQDAQIGGLSPFTIIHGPNEAGKSTLRRMLRDFLFGFPVSAEKKHPYSFSAMDASAKIELSDGMSLTVHRKRSTSSFVEFINGKMNKDAWVALLGGLDDKSYAGLLCCSGLEMSGTAEALQKGEFLQTVQRDISGGLRDDKAILAAWVEKLKEFGSNKHRKLEELDELKDRVTQASLAWRDMSSWTSQLEDLEREHELARDQHKTRVAQKTRLDSLVELAKTIEDLSRLEASLRNSGAPIDFPARARENWNSLEQKRRTQEKKLADYEAQIDELVKELAGIAVPNPSLLSNGPVIQSLQGSRKSVETILGSLPKHRNEQETGRKEIQAILKEHLPGVSLEAWMAMSFTESNKTSLESVLDALENRKNACERLGSELKSHRRTLDSLRPPESVSEQDRQLADLWSAESSVILQALNDQHKAAMDVDAREKAFRRHRSTVALAGMPALEMLMTMSLPHERDVRRLAQAWIQARDAALANRQEKADLDETLAEEVASREEDGLEDEVEAATPELLETWRTRRDCCWTAIRARFVDGDPDAQAEAMLELGEDENLVDEFDQALLKADQTVDKLLANGDVEARIAQIQGEINELETAFQGLEESEAAALSAWTKLWKPAKFVPGEDPESGLEWFESRMAACDSWDELETAKAKQEAAQAVLVEFAQRVAKTLERPSLAAGNAVEKAKEASEQVKMLAESIKRHEQENRKLTNLVAQEQEELATATKELELAQAAWSEAFAKQFPTIELPSSPDAFLEALEEILDQTKDLGKLEVTIAAQERDLDKVTTAIAPVLKDLGMGEVGASGLTRLLELWNQAEKDQAKQREVGANLENTRKLREEVASQSATLQSEIATLIAEAGCLETADFLICLKAWEDTAEDRAQLRLCRGRIDACDISLQNDAGARSALEWSQERDAVVETMENLDKQMAARNQEIGKLKKELQTKEVHNEAALDAKLALARRTTELNAEARSHLRNTLAKLVLEKARDSFTRSHTPKLQAWAGDYLSTMTAGQWASIDLSEESSLKIGNQSGMVRGENALSTGTADQVRLAIRMAVARQWAESHEPLPFLLDDVLVHTDDERMPRAMQALLELSKTTQVLYFTCHESVKEWGEAHGASVISVA